MDTEKDIHADAFRYPVGIPVNILSNWSGMNGILQINKERKGNVCIFIIWLRTKFY